ncbi:chromosome partitioning protein ParA [uncultured Psychrobacter sp.]|uniref:chromosome partitioning protein ParA n=1 Tax=uncultured Psychrobacter sp. TaxID=259303 RepID=UPI002601ECC3|nr:chromosome partitioning protein ParA [uncultured Psychrobacter sp.]
MGNKNKQSAQSSADNEQAGQADKTMNVTEAGLLNKQQELEKLEDSLSLKETSIAQKEQALRTAKDAIAKKESELNERRVQLEEMELQAKNGFPQLFEEKFAAFKKQLEQREAKCVGELKSLEGEKEKLRQREVAVQKAEIQRDNGYADARAKLDDELFNLRKEQEKELESKRANALTAIEKELSEERTSRIASLEKEIADRLKAHEAAIQQEKDELEQKRKAFRKDQAELDKLKDGLKYQEQRLQSRKEALEEREAALNLEVDTKVVERKQSFENEKSSLNDEISRLRESLEISSALISNFEELKRKLGDEDPAAVLIKLKTYEEDIKNLREDLATRPTQEMQEAFDRLSSKLQTVEAERDRYQEDWQKLYNSRVKRNEIESKMDFLETENKRLCERYKNVEAHNDKIQKDLERFQISYEQGEERADRIKHIEKPLKEIVEKDRVTHRINEAEWLSSIQSKFGEVGFNFPNRILKAFHTSLKIAEWSPLTVLAGVSGTGKSKLPELYAQFGGLNILNTPVQPNWDSKESMLGFYNSIDNYFDAQPILRFLAQSQLSRDEYSYGLSDTMNIVLLDEMNLAHIELYFAEFLSKLEERRGKEVVPTIDVKIGAKEDPYLIPIERNVLWVGTMNQDETTKSLSDKVLDRGMVINFPRPERLARMEKLPNVANQAAKLITQEQWKSWQAEKSIFNDDQILPFKSFIEEMNTSLSKVGRALGHRVWQSIEYYMANYPDVLEAQRNNDDASLGKAMKVAFEDQLVQKVMPKLRGIETRGKSKLDCLDKIRTQLVNDDYNIVEDFDLACEFGYGQFIWNSANYLKDDAFLGESNNNDSREVIVASAEQSNFHSSLKVGDILIPSELQRFASDNQKKLWQLTTNEIMRTMSCDVKEAKSLKDLCNKTKES